MANPEALEPAGLSARCGIVLSAGNGVRLRDFVYRRRTDDLPKQYLNFVGKRSMLEHTLHRAEKLIAPDRLFLVVAREHLRFEEVRRQLASRPPGCVVIQPENKDTGPGILLPLLHVHNRYPDALVAVFPSDHFILEEDLFMEHVERAFKIVEAHRSRIVLLGIEPSEPDPEYGYILAGEESDNPEVSGRTVEMFVEKPSAKTAKLMMRKGALWNTLVFVAACKTLLRAIQRAAPELYRAFERIQDAIGTPDGQQVTERLYQKLPALNFSTGILENLSYEDRKNLRVLPVRGVTWKDWGNSDRLSKTLRQLGAPDFAAPQSEVSGGRSVRFSWERDLAPPRRIR